jgi:hypothetical protein
VAVFFYLGAIVVVRRCATGRVERRYRWGTWALVVVFGVAALANLACDSEWENYLLAPVALVLAGLCFVVAGAKSGARGTRTPRPSARNVRSLAG